MVFHIDFHQRVTVNTELYKVVLLFKGSIVRLLCLLCLCSLILVINKDPKPSPSSRIHQFQRPHCSFRSKKNKKYFEIFQELNLPLFFFFFFFCSLGRSCKTKIEINNPEQFLPLFSIAHTGWTGLGQKHHGEVPAITQYLHI